MGKKQQNSSGLVYSTDQNFFNQQQEDQNQPTTLPKNQQKLRARIESKHRGGKTVVVIQGFVGTEEDLAQLGKWLKTKCGTGGSAKDGEIIIQGNDKEKIVQLLKNEGYTQTK